MAGDPRQGPRVLRAARRRTLSAPLPYVWLSGRFVPEPEARVPAGSRALLLGMGLYESIRISGGVPPLLDQHLERLGTAAERWGLKLGGFDWASILTELAERNQLSQGRARITLAEDFTLITCRALPAELEREQREGIELATEVLERPLAEAKSTSRFALEVAERQIGGEALLTTVDGRVLETTRANFFAVRAGQLWTAPPPRVLPGIARALVLAAARDAGIAVIEQPPVLAERDHWQECFVTNAIRGVRPVATIDALALARPIPGGLTRRMQAEMDRAFARA